MKKKHEILIIVLGITGILLNMLYHEFVETPNTFFDGLKLLRYFTLQSNLLVVVFFILKRTNVLKTERQKNFIGCVTLCITITFLMFAIFLEPIWNPTGVMFIASILLHYVVPLLTITYLILHVKEYSFNISDLKYWVIYPLCYVIFAVIYGSITGVYFYPFLDMNLLGVVGFMMSVLYMLAGYLVLSFILMKIVSQKDNEKNSVSKK